MRELKHLHTGPERSGTLHLSTCSERKALSNLIKFPGYLPGLDKQLDYMASMVPSQPKVFSLSPSNFVLPAPSLTTRARIRRIIHADTFWDRG